MTMKKNRITTALLFLLLLATTMFFMPFADPVWAQGDEGLSAPDKAKYSLESSSSNGGGSYSVKSAAHKKASTFKKNYDLTPKQKKSVIVECEDVVNTILKPDMSDLEKYYTLAIWANKRAKYDWDFWGGDYNFDYYNHQWDSYGVLYDKSICVSIAIFYSQLCHAAGLPCKFVRVDPTTLDHTISYIPDINGHDYYLDVTENYFLMSKITNPYGPMDEKFSGVTSDCSDGSFDNRGSAGTDWRAPEIKAFYDVPFSEWYREYAQHVDTKLTFRSTYREKGSGTYGVNYASYKDYSSNFTDKTDIWFLDDFYSFESSEDESRDVEEIKGKIINKEFDDRLMIVSGVKQNYDLDTDDPQFETTLAEKVKNDSKVEFFPSSYGGRILPQAAKLTHDDYDATSVKYDPSTHMATITLTGKGEYSGTHDVKVAVNSAVVTDEPVLIYGLVYNRTPQKLIEPGIAQNGTMQYAIGTETKPTGQFSKDIPTATKPGRYFIWYKAVSNDKAHADSPAKRLDRPALINKVDLDSAIITLSQNSFTYDGKVHKPTIKTINGLSVKAGRDYKLTWDSSAYKNAGIYMVYIEGKGDFNSYSAADFTIKKAKNPMKLKGKTVKAKQKSLKKKSKSVKRTKAIKVSKAKGKLTYKLVSAKKGKKSYKKKFKINKKTGKITIKKGLKKGTFKVKAKIKAKGNSNYNASKWKKVTFKVKVK